MIICGIQGRLSTFVRERFFDTHVSRDKLLAMERPNSDAEDPPAPEPAPPESGPLDERRTLSARLAEGIELSHKLLSYTGAARRG